MRTKLKVAVLLASMILAALYSFDVSAFDNPQADKQNATSQKKVDPAGWGGSHAGKEIPEYVHGDECLFCHRNDIGPSWQKNAHGITVRQREDARSFKRS
jgi:hypothetical protein